MPATGIEPVREYKSRRILSPVRLPVPPRRQLILADQLDGGGFEPPKQFAADLQSVPFGHSGIHPKSESIESRLINLYHSIMKKARFFSRIKRNGYAIIFHE